jgi:predicted ATPase
MLKKLIIHRFRSLDNVEIDLSNVNIFVGNNASGKSNVIDAIRLVKDAMTNGLDRAIGDRHGIESVRQWSPTRPYRMSMTLILDEGANFQGKYQFGIDSVRGEIRVFHENAEIYERNEIYTEEDEDGSDNNTSRQIMHSKKVFARDPKGKIEVTEWDHFASIDDKQFRYPLFFDSPTLYGSKPEIRSLPFLQSDELYLGSRSTWQFGSLRSKLANFQAYSIFPNTLRMPQEPSNETFLAPEGRNLASVFKRMRRTSRGMEALNQITEAMQAIMPNLERISVLTLGGFLVPQFHIIEPSGKKHIFNVSQLSDGSLRVLGLLTALYQVPKPAIIALEEPEQTVNPGVLTVLADSIKEVSRRSQILITTHSPNLLDQFSAEFVKTVEYVGGRTKVDSVNPNQMQIVRDRLFTLGELLVSEGLHA